MNFELNWANDLSEKLKKIKELYTEDNKDADFEANNWSYLFFGENVNGEDFWSIGKDYVYEIIKLLGHTKNCDKLEPKEIKALINNEKEIISLLSKGEANDFPKVRDILSLDDSLKKYIFDYIDGKFVKLLSACQLDTLDKEENLKTNYKELDKKEFESNGAFYVGENFNYHNLKALKIEIMDELENGIVTLNEIDKKYQNDNFISLCSELIIKDCSDWDDRITTSDEVVKFLSDEVYITVHSKMIEIWFNTSDSDLFGGHNPVLELHVDKDFKCVSME